MLLSWYNNGWDRIAVVAAYLVAPTSSLLGVPYLIGLMYFLVLRRTVVCFVVHRSPNQVRLLAPVSMSTQPQIVTEVAHSTVGLGTTSAADADHPVTTQVPVAGQLFASPFAVFMDQLSQLAS